MYMRELGYRFTRRLSPIQFYSSPLYKVAGDCYRLGSLYRTTSVQKRWDDFQNVANGRVRPTGLGEQLTLKQMVFRVVF